MPAKKGIFVFRFDYDLKDKNWHCSIAAYNQNEAQEYLVKLFPHAVITGISQEGGLHAISDQVRTAILESSKRKPGRPKGSGKKD